MKAKLLYDLWKFPPFRSALQKEAFRFLLGSALGLGIALLIRWSLGLSYSRDGLISLAFAFVGIALLQLVSMVRTLRAVLREHDLLER